MYFSSGWILKLAVHDPSRIIGIFVDRSRKIEIVISRYRDVRVKKGVENLESSNSRIATDYYSLSTIRSTLTVTTVNILQRVQILKL